MQMVASTPDAPEARQPQGQCQPLSCTPSAQPAALNGHNDYYNRSGALWTDFPKPALGKTSGVYQAPSIMGIHEASQSQQQASSSLPALGSQGWEGTPCLPGGQTVQIGLNHWNTASFKKLQDSFSKATQEALGRKGNLHDYWEAMFTHEVDGEHVTLLKSSWCSPDHSSPAPTAEKLGTRQKRDARKVWDTRTRHFYHPCSLVEPTFISSTCYILYMLRSQICPALCNPSFHYLTACPDMYWLPYLDMLKPVE